MHELPATRGMLSVALDAAAQSTGNGAITRIDLVVGALSSIVDDSVQFYFDILSRDTRAAGARLNFRRECATGHCAECGHTWDVTPPMPPACPHCDSFALSVTGGRDFLVESIEVEE